MNNNQPHCDWDNPVVSLVVIQMTEFCALVVPFVFANILTLVEIESPICEPIKT